MPRLAPLTPSLALVAAVASCLEPDPGLLIGGGLHTEAEVTRMIGAAHRQRAVDVLFVIDDSPSMAEEQQLLAQNFASFIEVLEHEDVDAPYRIAVTTTDMGNPWCDEATAERGAFVSSSCRDRADDFGETFDLGCADICDAASIEILPTTTAHDDTPRPRPWIERAACETNVGGGVTNVEAFSCIGPQGVGGCRFESPLEAMYQALQRMLWPGEPEYGFLRDDAQLVIVFVTDGTDCSFNADYASIFSPTSDGGDAVFWSDRDADEPTNALCWNAGVACDGTGEPYTSCVPANKDASGVEGVADEDAVLHPLRRYIDLVQQIEDSKRGLAENPEVVVSVISGVPQGYDGELVYAVSQDPAEQAEYGIGPGCTFDDGDPTTPVLAARPPVRERVFAEEFAIGDGVNLYSICQESYTEALDPIVPIIRDQIRPACMTACVADTDADADGLQPQCTVTQETPNDAIDIPPCNVEGTLPADVDACFVPLVDDALSAECAMEGWNLEFRIVRDECVRAPDGATLHATCSASLRRFIDCPNLPG